MKTLFLWGFCGALICIVLALVGFYILGGNNSKSSSFKLNENNFDGGYTISYTSPECGELGYQFKLKHQKDGYSSISKMAKSNCKQDSNGSFKGYIFPKSKPNLRVFWLYTSGVLRYDE